MAKWSENALDYYEVTIPQTVMSMVREFTTLTGQQPNTMLYADLIAEEFDEWTDERTGTVEDLKELADLVYVIYGYANAAGYDLDEAIFRVHENNVGRCTQPDGSVKRRADGKIMKNPDYPKVDLEDLL
jgi:predicted HAD superfamily Cof-like phosphohydrolase